MCHANPNPCAFTGATDFQYPGFECVNLGKSSACSDESRGKSFFFQSPALFLLIQLSMILSDMKMLFRAQTKLWLALAASRNRLPVTRCLIKSIRSNVYQISNQLPDTAIQPPIHCPQSIVAEWQSLLCWPGVPVREEGVQKASVAWRMQENARLPPVQRINVAEHGRIGVSLPSLASPNDSDTKNDPTISV